MRSSYSLQVLHVTQHGAAKCNSLQLHDACTIAMYCKYGMSIWGTAWGCKISQLAAAYCMLSAMHCKYGKTMWCTAWGCTIYQLAAAQCMRSSYALQVLHGTQHGAAKCTRLQLRDACTLAMYCKYGIAMRCTLRDFKVYQRAAAHCIRSSYALRECHVNMVHSMGLQNILACSCIMHAL
jgi:hypothetical protein